MTVMPLSSDFADKAVSTEDASSGLEVARIEAVLAALVETKVEAMKASSSMTTRRSGSAPSSPRRPRLTSSSTVSSSQNHHHHHHHHHRQEYHPRHERRKKDREQRRHGSAPCGEYIDDSALKDHHKHHSGKTRRRASESPRSPRKRRRHSRSPHILHEGMQDIHSGLDSRFELFGIDGEQDLALINFNRAREMYSDTCEFSRLHRNACYFSESAMQLKSHFDDEDYLALNIADEFEEEDTFSGPEKAHDSRERFHRPRKKRKKRRRRKVDPEEVEVELADPEELPPRARWTIVATACLLLAMSLLLVGVTLRMAPIIDDMGDGRRASVSKRGKSRRASTTRRKDSIRPARPEVKLVQPMKPPANPRELARARRHHRITMIVLGTFLFLLFASILAVVVTLTHSSFHSPAIGSRELAEHRAQLRKENEELLNSLNRDSSVPGNATAPP